MAAHTLVSCHSLITGAVLGLLLACPSVAHAADPQPVQLPKPRTDGGKPLMQALAARHSVREFTTQALPVQTLSDLLWAGFGVNRPATGGRTAPSAMNWQEIEVYVVTAEGAYQYDAKAHALNPVAAGDHRDDTGVQPFVKDAALGLVFVADTSKMAGCPPEKCELFASTDAAFIAQNVYLYCASEGLGCVVRASLDHQAIKKTLQLKPKQIVALAQTVGYAKQP